jgi:antitoxin component YwqK of YwqJK toxin-antitoxin module
MANKIILLLITIIITAEGYSQKNFPERFIPLLDFEFNEIVSDTIKSLPDGRYYTKKQDKNGMVIFIRTIEYKNNKKHGEALTFKKGLDVMFLANITNYCNGKKEGYYFNTDNHTFSREGYYKKDKKHGYWEISKNETYEKLNFKEGLKSGEYSSTDNTSGIKVKGQYKRDKKDGVWIIEDTKIEEITKEIYKNGKIISQTN